MFGEDMSDRNRRDSGNPGFGRPWDPSANLRTGSELVFDDGSF